MPVFYTPIPQNLRVGLANVSGSVFINNRTRDSGHFRDPYQDHEAYYQCLLVTGMVLISIFEVLRAVVYIGNLKEKVPELAGFWLISFLFQLPILLFFITDEATIIRPLERAVHSLYLGFLLGELLASFLALHVMTRKLTQQFHMRQFGPIQGLHTAEALPLFGLPYGGRSVLPMRYIQPH
ncbi:transmembrane protein 17A-like [Sinocyclocheilus anshuiensis]|uniref:transmembrane protein 17A-like n=1 Tax=Sinocyclocheilus anshuiensis TaxID=1608454 RepID=UPI0007BAC7BA|nr:PREDICTED: transmembrane protein 17A-like [Sinocyclocheilus anshuiensis]